jgi:hypothetical protein
VYRNDPVVPVFSLIPSAALFLATYLDGQHIAALGTYAYPGALTEGQIGLMSFAGLFFLYGFIGLISTWLEGTEIYPGKRDPEPSSLPVVAGVILSLLLTAVSGFFVRTLAYSSIHKIRPDALEGGLFAAMMLLIAILLALYRKFFMTEEVLAEDEHSDFPW